MIIFHNKQLVDRKQISKVIILVSEGAVRDILHIQRLTELSPVMEMGHKTFNGNKLARLHCILNWL